MSSVSAIVVGGGVNALGVVRSLGQGGVPVAVLDTNPHAPAMRSRHATPHRVPAIEGQTLMDELRLYAQRLSGEAVLFLTEEKSVETVSTLREQLHPRLRIRLPAHERLMQLMHKQGFFELGEPLQAPVPRTIRLQGLHDLPLVQSLRYPCALKPSGKSYEYGARFKKAYKVASADEVQTLYREIEPVLADMVVQEWIEGQDSEIYFCLQYIGRDGELVASFPGRKIRSWPPRIGGTASCTAAWEHEPELTRLTADFFRQVGFSGMGSMEYKRDERDGRFYMVEPTVGRTDFQEEVATVNGCNLPLAAHRYEMGLPSLGIAPVQPPRVWRDAQVDRWSAEQSGDPPDPRSAASPVIDAYWRWSDPLPALDHYFRRLRQAIAQRMPA